MDNSELDNLLKKDENDTIEFKSSFKYDFKKKQANKLLQEEVVEAIAGFLNTKGGVVVIGVDNEKNNYICGLEYDLKLFKNKSLDSFQQDLINKIDQFIGSEYHEFLNIEFLEKNDRTICIIIVKPSDKEVWFKNEFLCVRVGNTTRKFTGKKAVDYIKIHWNEEKENKVEERKIMNDLISKYVINRRHHGFRTVFVIPALPINKIIPLNISTREFLRQNTPRFLRFGDCKVIQNGYQFQSKTSDFLGEITDEGFILYREPCPMSKSKDKICIERTMINLIQMLKYSKTIYDKFGFHKEICIGLELTGVKDKALFSADIFRFLDEDYVANNDLISIKKIFTFDEFKDVPSIVKFFIQTSSRSFGLEIKDEVLEPWVQKYL